MHIALFDYQTVRTNAIGNCNWLIINGLKDEHDFTVFTLNFENPNPYRVRFVRVPVPARPLFLLFAAYHVVAPLLLWQKRREGKHYDLVKTIESNLMLGGSIVYAHFCHRAYLDEHWQDTRPPGLRGWARWLDHALHALLESRALRRAGHIIVPSRGLERELKHLYPKAVEGKIQVIPNPINTERMRRPADYNRDAGRVELGFGDDELVMVFVAAGHFERKGLPLLLEAMRQVSNPHVRLVVVGGQPGVLQSYTERARALGLANQVKFVGFQNDIRPYLWAADLFTLPSYYEVFPLVALEAAAAGLPLLVTPLNGVEEILIEGQNGWCAERNAPALAERIQHALDHRDQLQTMGQQAVESVKDYSEHKFVENWRAFYRALEALQSK
jgi:glycosyltransferase involved in cell wall biosynthesis